MRKLKVILGIFICICIVVGVLIATNNSDSAIKKYCKIMINGNYGDIIDIADLPDSEFITNEKKEEAKKALFEEMKSLDKQAITCNYTKANENDDTITYKLTINDSSVETIDLNKKTGKLIIDELYETKTITTYCDCTITLDGKEIKNPIKENSTWKYNAVVLSNIEYEEKITPKSGVSDEVINTKIKEESVDGKKIVIADRKTDLENGKDIITFSSEYDDGILSSTGTFDVVYEFKNYGGYSWKFEQKENENIKDTWNILGTWTYNTENSSGTLELKEENGQIMANYHTVNTGFIKGDYSGTYTEGKQVDGALELQGTFIEGDREPKDSTLTAKVNSKEKTITVSISNLWGNGTFTKTN